jgi:hypothetical protein
MRQLIWRKSPWDHNVHAFRVLGEVASEAICKHSALTRRLTEPEETDRACQACMLLHGIELAEQHGQTQWRFNE